MTQSHIKHASPDHSIHGLIVARWSPYAFDPRPVEPEKILACLEAARWAASSFNEQPWSFIIAPREQTEMFQTMLGCLVEANQDWAKHAGVLMLTVVSKLFSQNNKPNRVAEHDLGLAAANLTIQATSLGLHVHQMAGINPSVIKQTYKIPDAQEPISAIAVGYAADHARTADKALADRDQTPRQRKPLSQFVFSETWDRPSPLAL